MMSDAEDASIGYAQAADAYWQAGWRGILPLYRGHKGGEYSGLPTGFTGHHGTDTSYPDITAWAESDKYRLGNLCLRMPNNDEIAVVGIDVDHYGAKTGGKTLTEAMRRWGPLPPAPRTTSREGDFVSGIRLFRVPPGTVLATKIAFPELGIGDIEICQHHHRYVVCWPSIHPEGGTYWWRNDENQLVGIPVVDELPWLPQSWIDGLRVQPQSQLDDDALRYDVRLSLTAGPPSTIVEERLRQAIKELNLPGASRHDTCIRHVMALARLGKSGEPGVEHAMRLLCDVFKAVTSSDGKRGPGEAHREFIRMLTNDNIARELSQPGVLDWFNALAPHDSAPSPGGVDDGAGAGTEATYVDLATDDTRPRSRLEEIERGFWDSRESLAMIFNTALARMAPPWGVLAYCAAKALTTVRPCITLPPLIGGPGSLNWFAALVARSGEGKGSSAAASKLLIPDHLVEMFNVGSGEGIVAAYGRPQDDGDPTPTREAIMFEATEIDHLAAMNGRTGATTLPLLRQGFSGETLGFSYAAKDKRRHIRSHTYRMTLVLATQPERAGWLLADAAGGTPQRFMWFPATDSRISLETRWPSGQLELPKLTEWLSPREIMVPPEAADLIRREHVKRATGSDEPALDGHALFCREKFAFALAVLDGRVNITSEDWELSGVAADVSAYTRESTIEAIAETAKLDAVDRGEVRGIELAAADAAKAHEQRDRAQRILRWLLATVENAGDEGIANRELNRKVAGRDRRFLESAISHAATSGLIRQLEGTTTWVKI